jgi:hypothetical protein
MPALIVLHVLKPSEPLTAELLERLRQDLGREDPLAPDPHNRIEIGFFSSNAREALAEIERSLDRAARELGVDWNDYLLLRQPEQ